MNSRSIRDVGQPKLDECLDGDQNAVNEKEPQKWFVDHVELGMKRELVAEVRQGLFPTAYAIGFWRRRDRDGMTTLAEFVIARALTHLKTDKY